MTRLRILWSRLRGLFRASQLDRELQQEIAAHLEESAREYERQGLSPEEARRAAHRSFGGMTRTQEAYRDARSFASLDHLLRDLRHGLRTLRRSAGFSLVVLLVLSIGVGAITAIFVLLESIVLRPLPFPQSNQLVVVKHSAPGLNLTEVGISSGLYAHYSQQAQSLESLGVYSQGVLNLRVPGAGTERINVTRAGVAVFTVLRAKPALGRLFTEEDGRPGFMNLRWTIPILLSHEFWTSRFGRDPNVIGRILTLNENPRRVVGVLPEGFAFPDPQTQIWMLTEPPKVTSDFARAFPWSAVARLRPGVTAGSAQAELTRVLPLIEGVYADATPQRIAEIKLSPIVTPLKSAVVGDVTHVLWTLFGGMTLMLAIACFNAAALFATRAQHRRREIAVRQALGAHGHQVVRLFFSEALLLTGAAASLGLLLAKIILIGVIAFVPVELPRAREISVDAFAIAFAALLALLMAAFYAVLSARHQGRSLTSNLTSTGRWASSAAGLQGREPFIVVQIALALALMTASALMVKTYRNLLDRDLGFSSANVVTAEIGLPSRKADQHVRIYREVVERAAALPGVESASAASFAPLTPIEDLFPVPGGSTPVAFKFFLPGFFQTMGTSIVDGESFAVGEHITAPYPVVINAALARRLYPGERAVGKTLRRLNEDGSVVDLAGVSVPPFTIAGVAGDVRETTIRDAAAEVVYVPVIEPRVEQSIVPTNMTLVMRTSVPMPGLTAGVRKAIESVDPSLSVGRIRSMDSIVAAARAKETFVGSLLLVAASVSLLLGVVGIYGSVAQAVTSRTREIGIRLALGARGDQVLTLVMTSSVWAVIAGIALGIGVALAAARLLGALLFGVHPYDPVTLITVTGILLVAASAAALIAALRAAWVAPVIAMRGD